MAAVWLAPRDLGVLVINYAIFTLAALGGIGLIMFAFGLLRFPSRVPGSDIARAIADTSPDGLVVTDRRTAHRLRQPRLPRALWRATN